MHLFESPSSLSKAPLQIEDTSRVQMAPSEQCPFATPDVSVQPLSPRQQAFILQRAFTNVLVVIT